MVILRVACGLIDFHNQGMLVHVLVGRYCSPFIFLALSGGHGVLKVTMRGEKASRTFSVPCQAD